MQIVERIRAAVRARLDANAGLNARERRKNSFVLLGFAAVGVAIFVAGLLDRERAAERLGDNGAVAMQVFSLLWVCLCLLSARLFWLPHGDPRSKWIARAIVAFWLAAAAVWLVGAVFPGY